LADLLGGKSSGSDEGEALRKARAFYDRVLVGYGDDSVAQLGGAHIACENVSNVAAKILEDARIGIAPLEKSTRYVRFDQKDARGEFLYVREPRIMASPHAARYVAVLDRLFETYARQIDPMIAFVGRSLHMGDFEFKHPQTGEPLAWKDAQKDETLRVADTAFRPGARARLRRAPGYLPAATRTNVGCLGMGLRVHVTKMYSQDPKK
jgi:thymidylate synthase ThyX